MIQSSDKSSEQNLAEWSDTEVLDALRELANIRDDTGASRFLQRFPDFLVIEDTGWLARLMQEKGRAASQRSVEFFEAFRRTEKRLLPTSESHVRYLGAMVQAIWRGTPEGARLLLILMMVNEPTEAIKVAVALRDMRKDDENIVLKIFSMYPVGDLVKHLQPDWTRQGRFWYEAATPLQKALYALWSKSALAKVCKNPDCPAPFFIARRVQQQYCGDECATPFRLEAKMKWWDKVGKRRREEASKSPKKRGKRR